MKTKLLPILMVLFITEIVLAYDNVADWPSWWNNANSAHDFTFDTQRNPTEDKQLPFGYSPFPATMSKGEYISGPPERYKYTLDIDNAGRDGFVKYLWMQYVSYELPGGMGVIADPCSNRGKWTPTSELKTEDLGNNLYRRTCTYVINPQPDWEKFTFLMSPFSSLKEVAEMTICIPTPEPATLFLLTLGGLILRKRKA